MITIRETIPNISVLGYLLKETFSPIVVRKGVFLSTAKKNQFRIQVEETSAAPGKKDLLYAVESFALTRTSWERKKKKDLALISRNGRGKHGFVLCKEGPAPMISGKKGETI